MSCALYILRMTRSTDDIHFTWQTSTTNVDRTDNRQYKAPSVCHRFNQSLILRREQRVPAVMQCRDTRDWTKFKDTFRCRIFLSVSAIGTDDGFAKPETVKPWRYN